MIIILWLVIGSSSIAFVSAQDGDDVTTDDGIHETLLKLNPISSIVNGTGFTVSGVLIDSETGEQLSGKTIRFEVTPAFGTGEQVTPPALEETKTIGIRFEDSAGIAVNACATTPEPNPGGDDEYGTNDDITPDCSTIDVGDIDEFNQILYLHAGAKIILPERSNGAILTLQDMQNDQVEVTVTAAGNESLSGEYTFTERSMGQYPNAANFHVMAPTGIKEIKIESVGDDIDDLIGISLMRTFDPRTDPITKYNVDFEDLLSTEYGNELEVDGGSFFVDSIAPAQASTVPWSVTAFFDGDATHLPNNDTQQFFVYPASFGGGGGSATILPDSGTGITTVSCGVNDGDKDGICNSWETTNQALGIPYTNGTGQLGYYSLCDNGVGCPNANEVDLYVEIDAMNTHAPDSQALTDVTNAFQSHSFGGKVIDFHPDTDEVNLTEVTASAGGLGVWVDPDATTMDTNVNNDFFYVKKFKFGTAAERVATATGTTLTRPDNDLMAAAGDFVTIQMPSTSVTTTAGPGGIQGKVVITAQVKFYDGTSCSGTLINPGTLTPSVTMVAGAHASLDAGTPTVTISSPTSATRRVTVTIPIGPDTNISGLGAGTPEVKLTRAASGARAEMCFSPSTALVYATNSLLDAKAQAYHYSLWVDSIGSAGPSGVAEVNGNDLIVALGQGFTGANGSVDEQAGTFMHELGHNLNLDHGGPRYLQDAPTYTPVSSVQYSMNCKPNYISVMTYALQFPTYLANRPLDFSSESLARTLNENDIDESLGLQSTFTSEPWLVFGKDGAIGLGQTYWGSVVEAKIDWNMNGLFGNDNLQLDVNDLAIRGCGLDDTGADNSILGETMTNYHDWNNIELRFRENAGGSVDGVSPVAHVQREITNATYTDMVNQVAAGLVSDRSEPQWYPAAIILGVFAALAGAAFILIGRPTFPSGKTKEERRRREEEERRRRSSGTSLPGTSP